MRATNPTREQKRLLDKNGLIPAMWQVLQELPDTITVKHRLTGEVKVIDK